MNISPRTGRVTLTKMDRQTVERFVCLSDAMHHHLSKSDASSDVKIGQAAYAAKVYAKGLLAAIDGVDIGVLRDVPAGADTKDDSKTAESVELSDGAAVAADAASETPAEPSPKGKTKRS